MCIRLARNLDFNKKKQGLLNKIKINFGISTCVITNFYFYLELKFVFFIENAAMF